MAERLALILGVPLCGAVVGLHPRQHVVMISIALSDHFIEILFLAFVAVMILRAIFTQGNISARQHLRGHLCLPASGHGRGDRSTR